MRFEGFALEFAGGKLWIYVFLLIALALILLLLHAYKLNAVKKIYIHTINVCQLSYLPEDLLLASARDEQNCPGFDLSRIQRSSKEFGCWTQTPLKSMGVKIAKLKMPILLAKGQGGYQNE